MLSGIDIANCAAGASMRLLPYTHRLYTHLLTSWKQGWTPCNCCCCKNLIFCPKNSRISFDISPHFLSFSPTIFPDFPPIFTGISSNFPWIIPDFVYNFPPIYPEFTRMFPEWSRFSSEFPQVFPKFSQFFFSKFFLFFSQIFPRLLPELPKQCYL